jgi:16S rRNA (uracil1498-N3)-methyltransferase
MSLYHFTGSGAATEIGTVVRLDPEESHHLCDVRRARPGAELALTDGRGFVYNGTLLGRERDRARVRIDERRAVPAEGAAPRIRLACAVVKGRRFEWALEKAVEAGAHAIVPLVTQRGVVRPRAGKPTRWAALIRAAVKQAERCIMPELAPVTELAEFLAAEGKAAPAGMRPDPLFWGAAHGDAGSGRAVPWSELAAVRGPGPALAAQDDDPPAWLTFLVGPEGGWTEAERVLLEQGGAVPVWLGPHTLRTETAALAGVLALQALRQVWRAAASAGREEPAEREGTDGQE